MGRRDGVKIPMLVKEHYFHWKVKMRMNPLSLDPSYINCIEKGPHVLVKINTALRLEASMAEPRAQYALGHLQVCPYS